MEVALLSFAVIFLLAIGKLTQFLQLVNTYIYCEVSDPASRTFDGLSIDIAEAPYQASLHKNNAHHCGASIISPRWVLSAAHCIEKNLNPAVYSVRVGSTNRETGGTVVEVGSVILHPKYNVSDPKNFDYDITLLKLTENIGFTRSVQQISLPKADEELENGVMCTVSGWSGTTKYLRAVNVPFIAWEKCAKMLNYDAVLTKQMLCAGYAAGGKDSCQGDSGGPLMSDEKLFGVVSWGEGCGIPNRPGVYTRVASVRDWIKNNTGV